MDTNLIVLIIVVGIFQIIILYGIISSLIALIKSLKYKNAKAVIIDNVILGSKDWGKYFPEEYEKIVNIGSKVKSFSNKLDNLDRIRNSIPLISIGKNSIFIKKTTMDRKDGDDNDTYTMVAEFRVNNKNYYYYERFINESSSSNPFKNMIGKEIEIKYNPSNPKKNIRKESNFKGTLLFIVMEITFILIFLLIIDK